MCTVQICVVQGSTVVPAPALSLHKQVLSIYWPDAWMNLKENKISKKWEGNGKKLCINTERQKMATKL